MGIIRLSLVIMARSFVLTIRYGLHAGFLPHTRSKAKFRPILLTDWPASMGENRPDQKSQTFGGCVIDYHISLMYGSTKKL